MSANTAELGVPEIIVDTNSVTVCGTVVQRPESIAPSQWRDFWEDAARKSYIKPWGYRGV